MRRDFAHESISFFIDRKAGLGRHIGIINVSHFVEINE